ncbi:DUF177 domain-containing protein [Malonomonas rubra]|uniref:YceD family protein n=1 Tax=Malonomonas rubra TaxID=57040 RepID=UPI0026ED0D81|nr:DUF177 domain-containing protein [Malonomonas rubra]
MHLELKDIKEAGLNREMVCNAADFPVLVKMEGQEEVRFVAPVIFQLRFQKLGQLVEVDGHFKSRVNLICGRCLQPYDIDLSGEFAFTFTPHVADENAAEEGDEVELETDELGLVYYKDESLELLPPLQDQLVMALPISPLCSEDCAGLCSECGCNLNVEKCHCEKKVFNNKFSALAGLKIESSDK